MGVNVSKQNLSLSKEIKFGSDEITTVQNPVKELLKKSRTGSKISESQKEELSVRKYVKKEEYREFIRLAPSQIKRINEEFKRSPEYKKFKQALNVAEQSEIMFEHTELANSVWDNEEGFKNESPDLHEAYHYTGDELIYPVSHDGGVRAKHQKQPGYRYKNTGGSNQSDRSTISLHTEAAGGYREKVHNAERQSKSCVNAAASEGINTAARGTAAAGSGGTSEVAREAVKAVRKYADTIKEAVNENKPEPQDTEKPHSSNSAVSETNIGIIQKVTAAVMALVSFLMAQIGVLILPLLVVIAVVVVITTVVVSIISSIAAALTPDTAAQTTGGMKMQLLSANTFGYIDEVKSQAEANGIEEYVNYLIAIIEVESHGNGTDVMQSSESAGLPLGSFTSAEQSIRQGVGYFAECIKKTEQLGCDINTAVQSYNYGSGFADYIAANGNQYSLELAISFAMEKSNGITTDYANEIAVDYNGGWRYAYGNMFYVQLINQYIYNYEDATVQSVIDEAYKFYGWDYVSGGCSPDYGGFDCSGLVQYVYRQAGIDLPRLEKDQFAASTEIPLNEIMPGDLLFYSNETSGGEIGHVAIYLGDGKVFEAGDPIGVYDNTDSWHTQNLLCAGRVINRLE